VLGAFAGIRSDELFPERRVNKDGLEWRHVDREHGVIRIPANIAKTGHPRIIPILPNLEAWLAYINAPKDGKIIIGDHEAASRRRRTALSGLWKKNGLRHSFGTYRTAQIQNLPQVALEMGNSIDMIRRHYFEAVTRAKGEEWFGISPA
jgi:integrase